MIRLFANIVKILINNKLPKRGDVIVFKHPIESNVNYIKRIVGVPGDKIEYNNKKISICVNYTNTHNCKNKLPIHYSTKKLTELIQKIYLFQENNLKKEKIYKWVLLKHAMFWRFWLNLTNFF